MQQAALAEAPAKKAAPDVANGGSFANLVCVQLVFFVAVSGSLDDANKLQHMQDAAARPDAFRKTLLAEDDLRKALDWVLEHSAEEVVHTCFIAVPQTPTRSPRLVFR